ncbi:hypothetical protein ACFYKX_07230 [Cytobacillus sp. FJAT-54145]|uniref:Uncharacterized protein n=1 Tax=Cytobacillus spartinae TaxID=3299023 RepID=A0ABW6K8B2_9BACI
MRNKIQVKSASISDNKEFLLYIGEEVTLDGLNPSGTMLVDSDQCSFIYLAENEDEDYTYIILDEAIWGEIKTSLENPEMKAYIAHKDGKKLELIHFQEELLYLIENIKGNSNYGDEMVGKVEATF